MTHLVYDAHFTELETASNVSFSHLSKKGFWLRMQQLKQTFAIVIQVLRSNLKAVFRWNPCNM